MAQRSQQSTSPTAAFVGLELDVLDVGTIAAFWSQVLQWPFAPDGEAGDARVDPQDGSGYPLILRQRSAPKAGQNPIHLDVTSDSPGAMADTIDRALRAGGRLIDIGQSRQEGHEVLADPEGNEFCVIEPGNAFLAETGVVGAINCDGTAELGRFWSWALGWPLVWDQDEETAIQSPKGGSKITWSGPPLMPRHGPDRLRLVVTPVEGVSIDEVIAELLHGGSRLAPSRRTSWSTRTSSPADRSSRQARSSRHGSPDHDVVLLDPDGNEFVVTPAR